MIQTKQVNLIFSLLIVLILNISCKGKESKESDSKNSETPVRNKVKQKARCKVKVLTSDEFDSVLNSGIIDNIDYKGDLVICYEILDRSGNYFLILTRDYDKNTIHAYYAGKKAFDSDLIWNFNDSIIKNNYSEEYDINFLKKYILVKDLNEDYLVDIIITYKTKSKENYDRLQIVTWCNGSKTLINHEGAILDDERETKIDEGFYTLPKPIRKQVYEFMKDINLNVIGINSDVLDKIGSVSN